MKAKGFLFQDRRTLLREFGAAWVSITAGALLCGLVAASLEAILGRENALAVAISSSVCAAYLLLNRIRDGRPG